MALAAAVGHVQAQDYATVETSPAISLGAAAVTAATAETAAAAEAAERPFARPSDIRADPAPSPEAADRYTVEIGATWVSAYYFRGLRQEDDGFIIQPYANLGVLVAERENASLSLNFGVWNSIHGDTSTAGAVSSGDPTLPNWYEFDFVVGPSLTLGRVTFDIIYGAFTSPNSGFNTVHDLSFSVSYNDAEDPLLGPITLNPYATVAIEVGDVGMDGFEPGGYLELGIAPSYTFKADNERDIVTLSLPVTLGLNLYDYFETATNDDTYGFVDVGLDAAFPIPIDAGFGALTFTAGIHVLFLGDSLSQINFGDDTEVIGSSGLSLSF